MKDRLLNVLAWGVWVWAIVFAVGITIAYVSEQLFDGRQLNGLLAAYLILVFSVAPILAQWVLFYIFTGSPRFLPWQRTEAAEDE